MLVSSRISLAIFDHIGNLVDLGMRYIDIDSRPTTNVPTAPSAILHIIACCASYQCNIASPSAIFHIIAYFVFYQWNIA